MRAHKLPSMKKLITLIIMLALMIPAAKTAVYAAPADDAVISESAAESTDAVFNEDTEDSAALFAEFESGSGTQTDPYIIKNAEQLNAFAQRINVGFSNDAYFALDADIDLGNAEWTPVGYYASKGGYSTCFQGEFDGRGHTVKNFKITSPSNSYVGFFGFVYNGTVKNLTVSDFNIEFQNTGIYYAGALAGRCIAIGENEKIVIDGCRAENGSINVTSSDKSVYAGGLLGYFMSSTLAESQLSDSFAKNVSLYAYSTYSASTATYVYAGGLVGYTAATSDAFQSISGCGADTDVNAYHNQTKGNVKAFGGGLFGFVGAGSGDTRVTVEKSFASGNVTAQSFGSAHAGGLSPYVSVSSSLGSQKAFEMTDCYASGNVYAKTADTAVSSSGDLPYSCVGGIAGYFYDPRSGASAKNVYASGNAADTGSLSSYVGKIYGYRQNFELENCYAFDFAFVNGSDISDGGVTEISLDKAYVKESYNGFDFDGAWCFDKSSGYALPVLSDNMHFSKDPTVTYINVDYILSSSTVKYGDEFSAPQEIPSYDKDRGRVYEFSHWSLVPNGSEFTSGTADRNTNVYAVYNITAKKYTVEFVNGTKTYVPETEYSYGDKIVPPETQPEKASDVNFWYTFSHWSLTPDGTALNFDTYTVSDNVKIYAVYKAYDFTVWDGKTAKEITRGNGSENNPYKISNGYQLFWLSEEIADGNTELAKAYFEVDADIQLGNFEWLPIGNAGFPFSGSFDGGGYTINGLKITDKNLSDAGLFGYVKDAVINGVVINGAQINIESENDINAGILCGTAKAADGVLEISEIKVSGNVSVISKGNINAGAVCGKLVAEGSDAYINNSYSDSRVYARSESNNALAGGISAYVSSSGGCAAQIRNCYSLDKADAAAALKAYAGGICAEISVSDNKSEPVIFGCFTVGGISAYSDSSDTENAYAGHIAGLCKDEKLVSECIYYRSASLTSYANGESAGINESGIGAMSSNFRNQTFLSQSLGFDFENVWEIPSGYSYPVLKSEISDKPVLSVKNIVSTSSSVSAEVTVMSDSSDIYTVSLNVYSERGRLVASKTVTVNNYTPQKYSVIISASGLPYTEKADSIKVIVNDKKTLEPLFSAYYKKI